VWGCVERYAARCARTWRAKASRAKFSGKYLVVRIEGELTMNGGKGTFKGEDPGFLWRGRAKDYIEKKLAKYLDPKEDPAQLPTTAWSETSEIGSATVQCELADRQGNCPIRSRRRHALPLETTLQTLDDAPQRQVIHGLHGVLHVRRKMSV
jgi:hypothetical protein